MTNREQTARSAAATGADYAYDRFRTDVDVERKTSEVDLVTEIDRETQRRTVAAIREAFPDDEIVAEEGDERETVPEEGYAWIIDPIDGTQNYTRGTRAWVTSVAVVEDGRPVASVNAAPALGDTYVANEGSVHRDGDAMAVSETTDPAASLVASTLRLRDEESAAVGALAESVVADFGELRRTGSAQLTLSMVADGALDATVGLSDAPNSWDTVAGIHHVREAGGTVTDVEGDRWEPGASGLVASNGEFHDEVLSAARRAVERVE
jgi:myo-inositol-1(or 4)-monophosphatase